MTLSTKIEVFSFYGFYICSQWAFIHALLSRIPFALAGLSCTSHSQWKSEKEPSHCTSTTSTDNVKSL